METFWEKRRQFFDQRTILVIVIIELAIVGTLLCMVLLGMAAQPTVALNGESELTVVGGTEFEDPGAVGTVWGKEAKLTVTGQVDTDQPGTYTLCYQTRFLFATAKVCRTVTVARQAIPYLELTGGETVTVAVGDKFTEPGYRATGEQGENLTGRVKVSGTVDTETVGSYEITYSVTDDQGRTTELVRTVEVKPVIYLTFDDGPGQYTQQLLDVLAKYDVKATFFVVNTSYSKRTETLQAIAEAGHTIGIHSMSHNYETIYASEEAFLEDLYAMQNVIYQATGVKATLMRFPGGSSNSIASAALMSQLTQKVKQAGFTYFDWNVDSRDASGATTADEVYKNVISGIEGKTYAVVLQHDIKSYSVAAVERIIQWGLANGYTFQALTASSPSCQHR